jgi:type IV pilus assembly protein PilY1
VIVQTVDANGTVLKRALIRMSDKTVKAPEVPESAAIAAAWRRIYWRPVNR